MPLFKKQSAEGEKAIIQVRAALAIMFSLGVIGGFFYGIISQDSFMPFATMALAWYFSKRDTEDNVKKKNDTV